MTETSTTHTIGGIIAPLVVVDAMNAARRAVPVDLTVAVLAVVAAEVAAEIGIITVATVLTPVKVESDL